MGTISGTEQATAEKLKKKSQEKQLPQLSPRNRLGGLAAELSKEYNNTTLLWVGDPQPHSSWHQSITPFPAELGFSLLHCLSKRRL